MEDVVSLENFHLTVHCISTPESIVHLVLKDFDYLLVHCHHRLMTREFRKFTI